MIEKLENNRMDITRQIRAVFQASYAVEATLLKAEDFPPLQRPLEGYQNTDTEFFGYWEEKSLAAVIEIATNEKHVHIQSLVVDPAFFRRGIGKKMVLFVFEHYSTNLFYVETGVDNSPAIALYEKLGFRETKQWDTKYGIRKVSFERKTI